MKTSREETSAFEMVPNVRAKPNEYGRTGALPYRDLDARRTSIS